MFENLISSSLLAPLVIALISAITGFFVRGGNRRETEFLKKENYRLKHIVDVMLDKASLKSGR